MKTFRFILFGYVAAVAIVFISVQSSHSQTIPYTDGNNSWNPDLFGNHRAVIEFMGKGNVAKTIIEWRRRDFHPELKAIIVIDAQSGKKILNVRAAEINRERGVIYFEPVSGKGEYYIYYMPYIDEGPNSYYPKGNYRKPEDTADEKWLSALSKFTENKINTKVKEIQSVNAFNSFYPMEVIATAAETNLLIEKNKKKSFLVFPEDRLHSIRMKNDLPLRWISRGITNSFSDQAKRGEFFTYQLGVFALRDLRDVQVSFSDLKTGSGEIINSQSMICLNTHGTAYDGTPYSAKVDVNKGKVQALWCAVDIPQSAKAGEYKGKVKVISGNDVEEISLTLKISESITENAGIDEPEKMTRLKWLNSKLAQDNTVIAPYTALTVADSSITLLGRKLILGKNGLPSQIQTYFTQEMTSTTNVANNILAEPFYFHFYDNAGKEFRLNPIRGLKFNEITPGTVSWQSTSASTNIQMEINGSLEFDGFASFVVKISALNDIALRDINFTMPMLTSKYMMGLGQKGGLRPDSLHWKWEVATKNQDGAWIGNVNAGLQFSLRDEKYSRPLNTNFYLEKPLLLPSSWGNENKGGIDILSKDKYALIKAYSGSRSMKKGETLYYNFNLLITPFHPINTKFQWNARFYHKYEAVDSIKKIGARIINIHHATPINPYINYPFIEFKKMKAYIDEAHSNGLNVKIYNTIRELSNKAYEVHALRSFGHEIFSAGKGGGFSWLQEHIGDDYIAAWFVPELKDAAMVNSGMNRWHNYYVEGMNWLTQNVGIDGIYLDDVAFDRVTMKRIKRVLTQGNHPGILDLHSANQFNKRDGFNNSANLYMEHFPYLNKLWFGEYFDYEKNNPDFFLTEVSGIPFGLMGEMLQDGGNAWCGMIYGMTNRMPWSDNANPTRIWKLWDDFGIIDSEMIGYWSENCPVKTNNTKVLVTVYKKKDSALLSIASWDDADVKVKLNIDWKKLGLDPTKTTLMAPEVMDFQPAAKFSVDEEIPVAKGKGWLLVVK